MADKFKRNPHGGTNELLNGEGFYLSFNANPCADLDVFRADGRSSETALAIENGLENGGTAWLILNGDYRAEYEEAFPRGLAACVAVYEAHRAEHRSSWSVDGDFSLERTLNWFAERSAQLSELPHASTKEEE